MAYTVMRYLLPPIALGFGLLTSGHAADQKLTVEDVDVFYGVVPVELVQKQAEKNAPAMHEGRVRKNFRHLVVALYDVKTGKRISDATVDATVTPLGLAPSAKRLQPMHINDTVTFGNFFEFPPDGARVDLKIARPNRPAHSTGFDYRP